MPSQCMRHIRLSTLNMQKLMTCRKTLNSLKGLRHCRFHFQRQHLSRCFHNSFYSSPIIKIIPHANGFSSPSRQGCATDSELELIKKLFSFYKYFPFLLHRPHRTAPKICFALVKSRSFSAALRISINNDV